MKVLLLTQLYSDKPISGGVRIVWNYSQELAKQGAKVYVVANKIDTDRLPQHKNLKVYKVPLSSYAFEPVSQDVLKSFFFAIPLILWHRIKIVHMVPIQTPCPFSRFKFGAKFIESAERTWDYESSPFKADLMRDRKSKKPPNFTLFEKLFLRFSRFFYWVFKINQEYPYGADAFFCRSNFMSDYVRNQGVKSKLFYVPIGVNINEFKPQKAVSSSGKFIFLSSGALSYRKGTHHIIDAYKEFDGKYSGKSELWLVGNSESAILQELRQRAGGNSSIKFIDGVPPNQIMEYYSNSDVCISAALICEHGPIQPNVSEAMVCGRPVIIGNYAEARVLDNNKAAYNFEIGSSQSLFQAMERLFTDRELRLKLSKNANNYAVSHFSWESVTSKCLTYYQEILDA